MPNDSKHQRDLLGPARCWFLEQHRQNDGYLGAQTVIPMPSIADMRARESEKLMENRQARQASVAITRPITACALLIPEGRASL